MTTAALGPALPDHCSGAPAARKLLSDYVLLIPKSKLEDTLKPRAGLLEKKPEKKSGPRS